MEQERLKRIEEKRLQEEEKKRQEEEEAQHKLLSENNAAHGSDIMDAETSEQVNLDKGKAMVSGSDPWS
ncbi:hypothetical protein A2U01_0081759 [Trifolium medium]|uniref:Uncharacterized protein n=1 Tax=Trifolium medium TaxID=97028 RepID=A0A392THA2_9FABA|nr:hypothetical protein [Trifolium medium]